MRSPGRASARRSPQKWRSTIQRNRREDASLSSAALEVRIYAAAATDGYHSPGHSADSAKSAVHESAASGVASVLLRTVRPVPAYISRHDLLDRFRLDAEFPETRQGSTRHVIRFEQVNLACGERWVWQELEQPRLNLGYREGQGDEQPPSADET